MISQALKHVQHFLKHAIYGIYLSRGKPHTLMDFSDSD